MKFKVGDEVCVCFNFERYKQACLKGKRGFIVEIDECQGWNCPITVKFEGIYNHNSKYGYFYFKEDELRLIHKTDNFDIIDFNKRLKEIADKHGLISSYHWSDNLHGYLYDFYSVNTFEYQLSNMDVYIDKNRVARVLVKPNQIDKIDEALSKIDEHLAERLNPMSYTAKRLEHFRLDQLETLVKQEKENNMLKGKIKKVIFNDPATIVFWKDGTKTIVKASNEEFDPEKGLAMAIAKKAFGNEGNYFNEIKKWLPYEKTCTSLETSRSIDNDKEDLIRELKECKYEKNRRSSS